MAKIRNTLRETAFILGKQALDLVDASQTLRVNNSRIFFSNSTSKLFWVVTKKKDLKCSV